MRTSFSIRHRTLSSAFSPPSYMITTTCAVSSLRFASSSSSMASTTTSTSTVPTADSINKVTDIDNPYRSQVLSWYRKCLKAAFEIEWTSDGDALYVLEETRKLFRQNENILDHDRIARKLEEVEQRYGLAIHYKIPYPRMFHKTAGTVPNSLGAYASYLDSHYDYNNCEIHPGQSHNREDTGAPCLGGDGGGGMMRGLGNDGGVSEE